MPAGDQTSSDHLERLNKVLVHIQGNIDGPMNLETLAAVAHFSPFHFHRIFRAFIGETVYDHIRRLRLETAARKLCYSGQPVTEIALAAGYETPAAFTKEFKKHFARSPTEYQKMKRTVVQADLNPAGKRGRGEKISPIRPEIRRMPEQKVLFVRKTGSYDKAAAAAWSSLMGFAYSRRIMNKDTKTIGVSHDSPEITPEKKIRYDACITFKGDIRPEGEVGIQTIAGGRYAVFLHRGPYSGFDRTYNAIMGNWFSKSGAQFRDVPCFEVYLNRDSRRTRPENLRTEIYVPIE